MADITILRETPENRLELRRASDGREFLRIISTSPCYNGMLERKIQKQIAASPSDSVTPGPLKIGLIGNQYGLYFADMEKPHTVPFTEEIKNHHASSLKLAFCSICTFCQGGIAAVGCKEVSDEIDYLKAKIDSISCNTSCVEAINILLSKKNSIVVHLKENHGDLTLENVLVTEKECYLVGYDESFCSCAEVDIGKLFLDTLYLWTFRNTDLEIKEKQVLSQFSDILFNSYVEQGNDIKNIFLIMMMQVLRMYTYTRNPDDIKYLENILADLTAKIHNGL